MISLINCFVKKKKHIHVHVVVLVCMNKYKRKYTIYPCQKWIQLLFHSVLATCTLDDWEEDNSETSKVGLY